MKYKDFNSKFAVLAENVTSRYQQGGALPGDFCIIRKDALKNSEISNKPSNFIIMVKNFMENGLNLKVSAVKCSKPDSQNDLGTSPSDKYYVDVVTEYAPGLWKDPLTLPMECIDIIFPEGGNWSPGEPEAWKQINKSEFHGKIELKDKELNDRTKSNERMMPSKNTKLEFAKEPKDGRKQVKKPANVKESVVITEIKSEDRSDFLERLYNMYPDWTVQQYLELLNKSPEEKQKMWDTLDEEGKTEIYRLLLFIRNNRARLEKDHKLPHDPNTVATQHESHYSEQDKLEALTEGILIKEGVGANSDPAKHFSEYGIEISDDIKKTFLTDTSKLKNIIKETKTRDDVLWQYMQTRNSKGIREFCVQVEALFDDINFNDEIQRCQRNVSLHQIIPFYEDIQKNVEGIKGAYIYIGGQHQNFLDKIVNKFGDPKAITKMIVFKYVYAKMKALDEAIEKIETFFNPKTDTVRHDFNIIHARRGVGDTSGYGDEVFSPKSRRLDLPGPFPQ